MIYRFQELLKKDKIENFKNSLIKEGLILSWDYKQIIRSLKKITNFNHKLTKFGLLLFFKREKIDKTFIENFYSLLNVSGYYISTYKIDEIVSGKGKPDMKTWFYKHYETMEIEVNKMFDAESGIPLKLFHVTHSKNMKKIEDKGLIPLSHKKIDYHPERIYLFGSLKSAKSFKSDIINRYFLENENLTIIEIDSKLLNKIRLHNDPKFGGKIKDAFYTYSNIPFFAIVEYH